MKIYVGEDHIDVWHFTHRANRDLEVDVTHEEYERLLLVEKSYADMQRFLEEKVEERKIQNRNRRKTIDTRI